MTAFARTFLRRGSLAALLLAGPFAGLAQVQENPPPPPDAGTPGERPPREDGRPGREGTSPKRRDKGGTRPYERMMAMLKERHPEEYARLVELRRADPEAFRKELETKVRRAREAYKNRAKERMHPGSPGQEHRPIFRLMTLLKEKDPAEFERLQKLRQENPQAFREALHEMLRRARAESRDTPKDTPPPPTPPEEPPPNP